MVTVRPHSTRVDLRVLVLLARLGLIVTLAVGVAVPVWTYLYARHLVLLGDRVSSPHVHLPAQDLASYRNFVTNGPATFVVLGYDDLNTHVPKASDLNSRTVQVSTFAAQLAMLKAAGFQSVSPAEIGAYITRDAPLPKHAVLIVFNNGRERDWTLADNVLSRYGYSAVVSIDPTHVGKRGSGYLTWNQLDSMVSSKRWSVALDISGATSSAPTSEHGSTGPAILEQEWVPELGRVETAQEYEARISDVLQGELYALRTHEIPHAQLVEYPFEPGYPLDRASAAFQQLAGVVNETVSAGVLDLEPDTSVSAAYRGERLLPSLQVYANTTTQDLFARIQAAAS
jgi:hypothetical protein